MAAGAEGTFQPASMTGMGGAFQPDSGTGAATGRPSDAVGMGRPMLAEGAAAALGRALMTHQGSAPCTAAAGNAIAKFRAAAQRSRNRVMVSLTSCVGRRSVLDL